MPYNTSAIPRPEEVTGTSTLPLARIKKIVGHDDDIAQCSNGAAFAISVATEEFLRYLTEQAFNVAKSESKPRKNIQYKDIAAAVAKMDNLQFLSDTVPRTVTFKQVKEQEQEQRSKDGQDSNMNGTTSVDTVQDDASSSKQRTIAQMMGHAQTNTAMATTDGDKEPVSPARQRISLSMATSPIVDRSILPQSNGHAPMNGHDSDVDMDG